MNALEMKEKLQGLKNEAQNLLKENKVKEAEEKTLEVKILNAQIDIQEKLDKSNEDIENKNTDLTNLKAELKTIKGDKEDLMTKFTEATNTITELNDKVKTMQPIVDEHNKNAYEEKLDIAKKEYQDKFIRVDGTKVFESEDIQDLIKNTIDEDVEVSNKAKYDLSEKIMELFDKQNDTTIIASKIQEPSTGNKNLNPQADEFEAVYGFKRK